MAGDGVSLSQLAYLMVVRRGDDDRYRFLSDAFRDRPVEVLWDRRRNDRRRIGDSDSAGSDRRLGDRRQEPPLTWDNLGFLVARLKLDEEKR
jgi:hypothetical protein